MWLARRHRRSAHALSTSDDTLPLPPSPPPPDALVCFILFRGKAILPTKAVRRLASVLLLLLLLPLKLVVCWFSLLFPHCFGYFLHQANKPPHARTWMKGTRFSFPSAFGDFSFFLFSLVCYDHHASIAVISALSVRNLHGVFLSLVF